MVLPWDGRRLQGISIALRESESACRVTSTRHPPLAHVLLAAHLGCRGQADRLHHNGTRIQSQAVLLSFHVFVKPHGLPQTTIDCRGAPAANVFLWDRLRPAPGVPAAFLEDFMSAAPRSGAAVAPGRGAGRDPHHRLGRSTETPSHYPAVYNAVSVAVQSIVGAVVSPPVTTPTLCGLCPGKPPHECANSGFMYIR